VLLPDYAAYPNTAASSLYPPNAIVSDLAHEQGGVLGYVHPYEGAPPDPERDPSLTHALPIDVALGKVDYLEVMGFSDHKITASVWYRFLNSGFRLPAGAGTDAMANFASLRGPVGLNRVYVRTPEGPLAVSTWLASLRRGRSFVTNGPLLDFSLSGKRSGEEIELPSGAHEVQFTASLRSIVPIDHVELVCNGEVVRTLDLAGSGDFLDASGSVSLDRSGWCLARAWNDGASSEVLDAYPYATTNPIYVTIGGQPVRSRADDEYFIRWIDRIRESVEANRSWNTESERTEVLDLIARARALYAERSE
jgi:hypothetical protein